MTPERLAQIERRVARERSRGDECEELIAEVRRMKGETYCAYCGFTVSVDADGSIIAEHIKTCPKHPLQAAVAAEREACAQVAYEYARVSGASNPFALQLAGRIRLRSRSKDGGAADQGQQEADAHQHGEDGEDDPSHLVERLGDAAVADQPPQQPEDQAGDDEVNYQRNQGGQGDHAVAPVRVRPTAEIIAEAVAARTEEIIADIEACAAECRRKRVVPGDMERNYYGGGMRACEELVALIRREYLSPAAPPPDSRPSGEAKP